MALVKGTEPIAAVIGTGLQTRLRLGSAALAFDVEKERLVIR